MEQRRLTSSLACIPRFHFSLGQQHMENFLRKNAPKVTGLGQEFSQRRRAEGRRLFGTEHSPGFKPVGDRRSGQQQPVLNLATEGQTGCPQHSRRRPQHVGRHGSAVPSTASIRCGRLLGLCSEPKNSVILAVSAKAETSSSTSGWEKRSGPERTTHGMPAASKARI